MSDDYAGSEDSNAPVTRRGRKSPLRKDKCNGQITSTPSSSGSKAKRLKKASDQVSYAIIETKSPGNSASASKEKSPGRLFGSPAGTPTRRSSPKKAPSLIGLGSPASSPVPAPRMGVPLPEGVLGTGRHLHHGLHWLFKGRTDKNYRKPNEPQYNPRTLYVPPSFIKSETPAMQQWWQFKGENMDTVLFFKVSHLDSIIFFLTVVEKFVGRTRRLTCKPINVSWAGG